MVAAQYAFSLPDEATIRALLARAIDMYRDRDAIIAKFRDAINGKNPITAPQSTQFKTVAKHGYHLQAAQNEKTSRYRRIPEMKVLPFSVGKPAQKEADALERAVNVALDTIDMTSGGNVWKNVVHDVHLLDAGVERWEAAPAAFWPELVVTKLEGEDEPKDNLMRLYQDKNLYEKKKDEYIRAAGIPLRRVYVPLERFYPITEGPTIVETFEVEPRSLRSVLSNPLFNTSGMSGYPQTQDGGLSVEVAILHYCNQNWHAYYALGPSYESRQMWPTASSTASLMMGQPTLLHAYEHGLGETIYNYVVGRGGGWLNGTNNIDGVMKALLELNQDADELNSQILTYIRNVLWPTRVAYYDKQARGIDDAPPKPPVIPEGGIVSMFVGEKIENIVQNLPDFQLATWAYQNIKDRISELAGSPVLFGERAPGVNTGYHQQLQITQAEHLDAQLEASLAYGAEQGALKMLKWIKRLGERVYVVGKEIETKKRITAQYLSIDPKKLSPMPQLAAKVRDPRPTDFLTSSQAALQLTQVRPGHDDPMVSDAWALENLLGVELPEDVERQKLEEKYRRKLLNGDVITQMLGMRLGLALAEREGQAVTPEMVAGASPAFQQAAQQMNQSGEAAAMGGVSPGTAAAAIQGQSEAGTALAPPTSGLAGMMAGVGGGIPAGNPQPMQQAGRIQQILSQVTG